MSDATGRLTDEVCQTLRDNFHPGTFPSVANVPPSIDLRQPPPAHMPFQAPPISTVGSPPPAHNFRLNALMQEMGFPRAAQVVHGAPNAGGPPIGLPPSIAVPSQITSGSAFLPPNPAINATGHPVGTLDFLGAPLSVSVPQPQAPLTPEQRYQHSLEFIRGQPDYDTISGKFKTMLGSRWSWAGFLMAHPWEWFLSSQIAPHINGDYSTLSSTMQRVLDYNGLGNFGFRWERPAGNAPFTFSYRPKGSFDAGLTGAALQTRAHGVRPAVSKFGRFPGLTSTWRA
jgi:hypothetical protein